MKYYAVKSGRNIGIYTTWTDCERQVIGHKGAKYKSFSTIEEAQQYMQGGGNPSTADGCIGTDLADAAKPKVATNKKKDVIDPPQLFDDGTGEAAVAYVDGSYNAATKTYGSGAALMWRGKMHELSESGCDPEMALMRNVAGEIVGAQLAMQFAVENKIKKLTIHHDYEGVAKWCVGGWKTNRNGTTEYKRYYNEISVFVNVSFVKVLAHSGDYYNDAADKIAKRAAGCE